MATEDLKQKYPLPKGNEPKGMTCRRYWSFAHGTIVRLLRSERHNMIVGKPLPILHLWEKSTDLLVQMLSSSTTFLQSSKCYRKLEMELVHGTFIVQTLSLEHRVIMKFREWMLSKGYFSTGIMMKIKKRLLYHGHSDDQAKVTDCTMGTVLIEEDQERVTVLWAHC